MNTGAQIHCGVDDGIATLELQQPAKGNALSAQAVEALIAAVDEAVSRNDVHTLVLGGAGRHFCTGFDLSDLDDESDASLLHRFVRIELLLQRLWTAPVRTVAIAHGRTWGAGADLMTACDLRLGLDDTQVRFPGAGFGLVLGTARLAARVGGDRAWRMAVESTSLDAAAALDTGLLSMRLDSLDRDAWLACLPPPAVDRTTMAALRAAVASAGDAELATLVRSAARPGLKARIEAYRARQLQARAAR
ncbi:putative enoyl-CoA hydratase [Pigmentiphaga humi]|uniref:Putative enoyl-CoA hydratase n=1 Tax=Pigmentiphaga humi TaxID=2478468 RepID=A0A3P4B7X8_9BURK|nr:enoyl-CoA hydratase/isomerase family protein [Pigmentiphaga humi]VCU71626.1 putative enoyl-CoA hydratase [Pigmentiphaga humi]